MSKSAEKFDKLPQDFDKEAIWEGIEKPKATGFWQIGIFRFMALSSIVAVASLLFYNDLINNEAIVSSISEKTDENRLPIPSNQGLTEQERITFEDHKKKETKQQDNQSQDEFISLKENKLNFNSPKVYSEKGDSHNSKNKHQIAFEIIDENNDANTKLNSNSESYIVNFPKEALSLKLLPPLDFSVEKNNGTRPELNQKVEPIKNKFARNNIVFSTGVGTHRSTFTSLNAEEELLRSKLEKAQLDFAFGLSYERMLNRNYFISLSMNYSLFKDEINNAYLDESPNIPLEYNYKLHNHYHVVLGEIGLNRRFFLKNCFIDVSGGTGIKIFQNADADYFIDSEQLVDKELVKEFYQNNTDTYFTGKAAFGKFLTPRTFMRAGLQTRSKIRLGHSSTDSSHSLTPTHFFLEAGIRF